MKGHFFTCCVLTSLLIICNTELMRDLNAEKVIRRFERLEDRDRQQQMKIDLLQKVNDDLVKELHQLQKTCSKDVNSSSNDQHTVLKTHLLNKKPISNDTNEAKISHSWNSITPANLKQRNTQNYRTNQDLPTKLSHVRIRQTPQGSPVAFFAMAGDHVEHLGHGQPVIFDHVVTNIGQAYHQYTGIFTAPVAGLYVFSTTLRLALSQWAHFYLTVNGQNFGNLYGHESTVYPSLSFSAIVKLSIGDDVAIRCNNIDKSVFGEDYSSVSGFLLASYQDDSCQHIKADPFKELNWLPDEEKVQQIILCQHFKNFRRISLCCCEEHFLLSDSCHSHSTRFSSESCFKIPKVKGFAQNRLAIRVARREIIYH